MSDIDPAVIWSRLQEGIHHTATVARVVDFILSNWWWITAVILILAWLPRSRRS